MNKKYKSGLVLSGGAIRGMAHLGALKAMEEHNIKPAIIAGTSIGAIVGILYAEGYTPEEILYLFKEKNPYRYLKLSFPTDGLLSSDHLFKEIGQLTKTSNLKDLPIPVLITATNFNLGTQQIFQEGPIAEIVQASSAVPILFEPVKIGDDFFVDGGLVSNLPTEALEGKCEHLIGVNVNPIKHLNSFDNLKDVIERTLHLSIWGNVSKNIDKLNHYIEPKQLENFSLVDHSKMEEIFEIGYEYTTGYINENYSDIY